MNMIRTNKIKSKINNNRIFIGIVLFIIFIFLLNFQSLQYTSSFEMISGLLTAIVLELSLTFLNISRRDSKLISLVFLLELFVAKVAKISARISRSTSYSLSEWHLVNGT